MKLVLKSFSQEVSLENKNEVKYFVYFRCDEEDRELKLPVSKETSEALIAFAWDPTAEKTASRVDPDENLRAEATEFGGEEIPEEDPTDDVEEDEDDTGPSSEEEVPSL